MKATITALVSTLPPMLTVTRILIRKQVWILAIMKWAAWIDASSGAGIKNYVLASFIKNRRVTSILMPVCIPS